MQHTVPLTGGSASADRRGFGDTVCGIGTVTCMMVRPAMDGVPPRNTRSGVGATAREAATGVTTYAEKAALGAVFVDIVPVSRYNPTLLVWFGIIVAE